MERIPILTRSKRLRIITKFTLPFFPYLLLKLLGLHPNNKHITAYTTLANAYLVFEKTRTYHSKNFLSRDFVEPYINEYIVGDEPRNWWLHTSNRFFINCEVKKNRPSTMNMHGLARANITLLDYAHYYNIPEYVKIAALSALAVLENHQVLKFDNNCSAISYYYDTNDCTLNVNSEYAQWLSMLDYQSHTEKSLSMLSGIIRLLLNEQNENGSWFYFSKWHMEKYKQPAICDCHHSATVLYNLINIAKCKYIPSTMRNNILKSVEHGMEYFINGFFDPNTGKGKQVIGYVRPACSVQYAEAVFAFYNYLISGFFDRSPNYIRVNRIMPLIVDQMIKFVNITNGSAVSDYITLPVNINSIRWGNGPILEALAKYMAIFE